MKNPANKLLKLEAEYTNKTISDISQFLQGIKFNCMDCFFDYSC